MAQVPGKSLVTADALWRAPQERPLTEAEELLTDEVTAQANLVVGALPATEKRLAEIRARQLEDDVCRQVMRYCAEGWPSHPSLPSVLRPYWQVQNELTIQNGLRRGYTMQRRRRIKASALHETVLQCNRLV